jgi:alpha-tubulin suppressor-like RCC1 family protein
MCWGFNNFGQAGVSGASSVFSPTVVPTTNAITLTLGAFETCFLRSDSPVGECIGDNVYGELGQGIASDAGDGGDASDASGSGTDNLPHPVPATVDVGSLGLISTFAHSTGNQMGVVLKSGQIATWGQDNEGQLGLLDDSGTSLPTPTLVPSFDEVTDMSFMQYGACALRVDGTVWCWGSTAYGETGSTANSGPVQYTPAQVQGLSNVTAITAGLDHVCALIDGGTVDCWGWNTDGALGRATSAVFDPTPAPVEF